MAFEISFRNVEFIGQIDSVYIVVTTDIPCHLFCRLTDQEPRIHTAEVIRRGVPFMSELRFCFVSFEDNEQIEEGDTLTHSWLKPDWPPCITKWCYFWGYVNGHLSKSTSPIFKFHNNYQLPVIPLTLYESMTKVFTAGFSVKFPTEAAQTFKPIVNHSIYEFAFAFLIDRADQPGDMHFDFYRCFSPPPAGPKVGSLTIPLADLYYGGVVHRFQLPVDAPFVVLSYYTYLIHGWADPAPCLIQNWRSGGTLSDYPNGMAFNTSDGITWFEYPDIDMRFENWGYPF